MFKIITFLVIFFLTYTVNSQLVKLVNIETREGIPNANLKGMASKKMLLTDGNGLVDISPFLKEENIEIKAVGYEISEKEYSTLSTGKEVGLIPSNISLHDIIIQGVKEKQFREESVNKMKIITTNDVLLQNPQTAADMLSLSGNVFIQKSQQGGGSPMIRGFATNRLLYTVDGVRMNTAIFRAGNIQNVISLDPFAIQQAEVIFGPSSVLYGSDAIGGVMSFQTLNPILSLTNHSITSGSAAARISSANNEFTGHMDVNIGFKKFALLTSVSHYNFEDLKMGSYGPSEYLRPFYVKRIDSTDHIVTNENPKTQVSSGYNQLNLMQKLSYQPNSNWDFQYGFHYSETSNYDRYDRHIRYKDGLPRYGEWYYGPQIWMMNNLSIGNKKTTIFYDQAIVRAAHQFFEESRVSRDINKNNREVRIEKVTAYSITADFIKALHSKNKLLYGIDYVVNEVTSIGINENIASGISVSGASRYPQSRWGSFGVYLSDQHQINSILTIEASGRYNQINLVSTFDTSFYPIPFSAFSSSKSSVTGNIGFIIKPSKTLYMVLNASTGFRAPNVDDLGKVFDSEPGSVTVPNLGLEAEYAYNTDLNIIKSFGKLVRVEVLGYYTLLKNAMVRRDFTLNGFDSILYDGNLSKVQAIQNAAKAKVYGVQVGLTFNFTKELSFTNDFNYQLGEEELDDASVSSLRHAAPFFGVSRLTLTMKKLRLQLYTQYSEKKSFSQLPEEEKAKDYLYAKDNQGKPYSPSWATLNLKMMYRVTPTLSLSSGIENITDVRYRPYSSGIVAPGRNFVFSAKCTF